VNASSTRRRISGPRSCKSRPSDMRVAAAPITADRDQFAPFAFASACPDRVAVSPTGDARMTTSARRRSIAVAVLDSVVDFDRIRAPFEQELADQPRVP